MRHLCEYVECALKIIGNQSGVASLPTAITEAAICLQLRESPCTEDGMGNECGPLRGLSIIYFIFFCCSVAVALFSSTLHDR